MLPSPAPLNEQQVVEAMADAASRNVLMTCVARSRSAKDICASTGIPLTTVYRQIHRLESLGVLVVERSALTADGRKYDLYRSRVRAAHLDLDESGAHVSWQANAVVEERLGASRSAAHYDTERTAV